MNASLTQKLTEIREGIERGEAWEAIATRAGTTVAAVRVVGKGLGQARAATALSPAEETPAKTIPESPAPAALLPDGGSVPAPVVSETSGTVPWRGRYLAIDGANVAGWGRRKGEPRLAQVLALCRWLSDRGVWFTCWFDAGFRWAVKGFSELDSAVLERVLKAEPGVFKQSPAGGGADGETIKADPFVLRDAAGVPGGMVVSNDLYRTEAEKDPEAFGWVQREPDRFIRGAVAGNGDLLLGANGEVRIPVAAAAASYI